MIARLATNAVGAVEGPSCHDLAIGLDGDRENRPVCVRIEGVGRATGGIQPGDTVARGSSDASKCATHQDVSVGVHSNCFDRIIGVRSERIRLAGRGVEAGESAPGLAADVREGAAHQNPAIGLHRDRKNIPVCIRIEI